MIECIYTNSAGSSITFSIGTNYPLNAIEGLENPLQEIYEQKSPGIDGAQYIGSLYKPREITIRGAISSGTIEAMYTKRAAMNFVLNDRNVEGSLQINRTDSGGVKSWQINCIPNIKYASKDASIPTMKYQVTFSCSNPFLNILPVKSATMSITVAGLVFPVIFPVVFSTSSGSKTVIANNAGNIDVGITFTMTGPAVNPLITNSTTGEHLKFIGLSLLTGEVVTIRTGRINEVIVDTGGDTNGMQYLSSDSRFFLLRPGNNSITTDDDLGFVFGSNVMTWYDQLTGV